MIEVENISGSPAHIPNNIFGQHFNGEHFIFFESEQEKNDFLESLNVFSLEAWKAEANQLHNQLFESYYLPLQYEGEADIALTALNSAQYAQEALSLARWRNDTFDIIEAVTEAEAQQTSPQDFINSLPLFNG
jgi:CRISPR/Cas system CMR-associated protein Cmr5 small subunit